MEFKRPFSWFFWLFFLGCATWFGCELKQTWHALQAKKWPAIACTVLRSGVQERSLHSGIDYRAEVEYEYSFKNRSYRSTKIGLGSGVYTKNYPAADEHARRYPSGSTQVCRVNPDNPGEAVLEPDIPMAGLVIAWIPMVLWAVFERHALVLHFAARRLKSSMEQGRPFSEMFPIQRHTRKQIWIAIMGLFMALGFATMLWIWPFYRWSQARDWRLTPCTILRQGINAETHHQGGRSYEARLLYSYEFEGEKHIGSRLQFSDGMELSHAELLGRLAPFRVGLQTNCYVNPKNPAEAVLLNKTHSNWFFRLFTCALFGIAGILFYSAVKTRLAWRLASQPKPSTSRERIIDPRSTAGFLLAGSIFLSAVLATLSYRLLKPSLLSLIHGNFELVFLLYGGACVFGLFWLLKHAERFLKLWRNNLPIIRLRPGSPQLGQMVEVHWRFKAGPKPPESLEIWFEGTEEAMYDTVTPGMHGTDTTEKTTKQSFITVPAVAQSKPERVGKACLVFPSATMPSFDAGRAAIVWKLRFRANPGKAPELSDDYRIQVLPNITQ